MPRLSNNLVRIARAEHSYLPLLLRVCRDVHSARNELRWLLQYIQELESKRQPQGPKPPKLLKLCKERALGRPLQYILGNQPFGKLDILCRKHVLIPRNETESYTMMLAELLVEGAKESNRKGEKLKRELRILDLCTGSGCIALGLYSELVSHFPKVKVVGVDFSDHALALARRNLQWNIQEGNLEAQAAKDVSFIKRDILRQSEEEPFVGDFDLVISNPPYVSFTKYASEVTRSVRQYEPKTALIDPVDISPQADGTSFYRTIMKIASQCAAKLVVCEIGDDVQALTLAKDYLVSGFKDEKSPEAIKQFEFWRDNLDAQNYLENQRPHVELKLPDGTTTVVEDIGEGSRRVFVAFKKSAATWLGRAIPRPV